MKFNYPAILGITLLLTSCGSLRRGSDCGLASNKENVQQKIANTPKILKKNKSISNS